VRTDRRASIFVAVVFLAVIVAPGLIQTVSELRSGERPFALEVFRQPLTTRNLHAFEQSLEETSLVVKQLRPRMQYLEWRLLADAGEKAVLGRRGWLFYRPSVRYAVERQSSDPDRDHDDPLAAIRSFRDQLHERGIRLLVVPVPDKESIYPEMLAKRAEDAGIVVCERTRHMLDQLEQNGIEYVDLFGVFRRAKHSESGPNSTRLYLERDTHWSPEGARVAAGDVAQRVLEPGSIDQGDHAYLERLVVVRRYGDLIEMLRAPQVDRAIEPESLVCRQVVEADSGTLYRDAPESEVLILGDSFLRIYQQDEPGAAGFLAHLAREIGQPLSAIVNDGGASTLVRQALARRPGLLSNKRLVIWEFAERDIRFGTEGWRIVSLPLSEPTPR
jgi:SGNH hydrolase-like domain, acetyltransferase AlgX